MFLLPISSFFICILIYYQKKKSIIESVIVSWLFFTFCTWGITELLSIFNMLRVYVVAIFWCAVCIIMALVGKDLILESIKEAYRSFRKQKNEIDLNFLGAMVFCIVVAVMAVLRSQNLVDNVYHRLPKIMHWVQNGNVRQFATGTMMEIQYSQLVEYMDMHIYMLSGSDRLITIIQAGAYICSGCCIYGIGRKLHASSKFAWGGVWIYLLMPATLLETITTQTDAAAGLYLLSFIYFLMDYIQADELSMDRQGAMSAIYLAGSVMFGYLAKPTVCFAMIVFFCWMCIVRLIKRDKFNVLLQYAVIGGAVAIILFLPSGIRTYQYDHIPDRVDLDSESNLENEVVDGKMVLEQLCSPRAFTVVAANNLAANSMSRCFPKINNVLLRIARKCEEVLNYTSERRLQIMVTSGVGETSEPSPAIMFFLVVSWIFIVVRISRVDKTQFIYLLCATIGLILQAGLMGYSAWRQRYLIGVMAVLCPAFATVIEQIRFGMDAKIKAITASIIISSFGAINVMTYEIPYVVAGLQGGELYGYFLGDNTELYYGLLLSYINENGYRTVGMSGPIPYELVLWRGLDNLERMEHVNVALEGYASAKLEDEGFKPECIIIAQSEEYIELGEPMDCHGVEYICDWQARDDEREDSYAVMVRADLK